MFKCFLLSDKDIYRLIGYQSTINFRWNLRLELITNKKDDESTSLISIFGTELGEQAELANPISVGSINRKNDIKLMRHLGEYILRS